MAKSFIIKIEKTGIEKKRLKEFLVDFENRYQYLYDEPFGSFDYKEMLEIPVEDCNINLGIKGRTVFGFRFQYSKDYKVFSVRMLSPSTTKDWEIAFEFIESFVQKYSGEIIGDKGEKYSVEELKNFDYRENIAEGLYHIRDMFEKYDMDKVHLGTMDILTLDKKTLSEVLKSRDMVASFDEVATVNNKNIQSRPEQRFYITNPEENEKGVYGYYLIPYGKEFTLKISPNVEPRNHELIIDYGELQTWFVQFEKENHELTPPLDYYFIINNLPKDKIKSFGYDNIYCERLNSQEIDELFGRFSDRMRFEYEYFKNDKDGGKFYDDYRFHYEEVLKKELNVGRLTTLNHLAYILRFAFEKGMVSDFINNFYGFLRDYLEIDSCRDLREVILYSMNGRLGTILFNNDGKDFIKHLYGDKKVPELFMNSAKLYIESKYNENRYKDENYLFTPYSEEYYKNIKVLLEKEYQKWEKNKLKKWGI